MMVLARLTAFLLLLPEALFFYRHEVLHLHLIGPVRALDNGLARAPPMGYNSWNDVGCDVDESLILSRAHYLKNSGLADLGYQYVNLDDCWQAENRDATTKLLRPDPKKFPRGMRFVADAIHALGLKFGIYTDRGSNTCAGLPGSHQYEELDARQFANDWQVDFVKIDNCFADQGRDATLAGFEAFRDALLHNKEKRPILYSVCGGGWTHPFLDNLQFYARPPFGTALANSWRISADVVDEITLIDATSQFYGLEKLGGPGGWNDLDMLIASSPNPAHKSILDVKWLNPRASRTQFALFCVLGTPLLLGAPLVDTAEAVSGEESKFGGEGITWSVEEQEAWPRVARSTGVVSKNTTGSSIASTLTTSPSGSYRVDESEASTRAGSGFLERRPPVARVERPLSLRHDRGLRQKLLARKLGQEAAPPTSSEEYLSKLSSWDLVTYSNPLLIAVNQQERQQGAIVRFMEHFWLTHVGCREVVLTATQIRDFSPNGLAKILGILKDGGGRRGIRATRSSSSGRSSISLPAATYHQDALPEDALTAKRTTPTARFPGTSSIFSPPVRRHTTEDQFPALAMIFVNYQPWDAEVVCDAGCWAKVASDAFPDQTEVEGVDAWIEHTTRRKDPSSHEEVPVFRTKIGADFAVQVPAHGASVTIIFVKKPQFRERFNPPRIEAQQVAPIIQGVGDSRVSDEDWRKHFGAQSSSEFAEVARRMARLFGREGQESESDSSSEEQRGADERRGKGGFSSTWPSEDPDGFSDSISEQGHVDVGASGAASSPLSKIVAEDHEDHVHSSGKAQAAAERRKQRQREKESRRDLLSRLEALKIARESEEQPARDERDEGDRSAATYYDKRVEDRRRMPPPSVTPMRHQPTTTNDTTMSSAEWQESPLSPTKTSRPKAASCPSAAAAGIDGVLNERLDHLDNSTEGPASFYDPLDVAVDVGGGSSARVVFGYESAPSAEPPRVGHQEKLAPLQLPRSCSLAARARAVFLKPATSSHSAAGDVSPPGRGAGTFTLLDESGNELNADGESRSPHQKNPLACPTPPYGKKALFSAVDVERDQKEALEDDEEGWTHVENFELENERKIATTSGRRK